MFLTSEYLHLKAGGNPAVTERGRRGVALACTHEKFEREVQMLHTSYSLHSRPITVGSGRNCWFRKVKTIIEPMPDTGNLI